MPRLLLVSFFLLFAAPPPADTGYQKHPLSSRDPEPLLVRGQGLEISRSEYQDYLLARFGRSFTEDMVFDLCLARAVKAAKLAPGALDQSMEEARDTLKRYGGDLPAWNQEDRRVQICNQELTRLRLEALIRAERKPSPKQLRELFDEVYGVDGQKVKVRHIFVSWNESERRLREAGGERRPNRQEIREHALQRIRQFKTQLQQGKSFYALLKKSDDLRTKTLLQNPLRRQLAGLIEGYNYQRFGRAFAKAVRALKKGEFSDVVPSTHGLHLILLVDRKVTRFEDVREQLIQRFADGPILISEVEALRNRLLQDYKVEFLR